MLVSVDSSEKSAEEIRELFLKYRENGDIEARNTLVLHYMNIVRYAAVSTRNMYQKYADSEDIVNEATIALMKAVDSFDPDKNIKFETYASIRVRGAVIDYIRRQDFFPRSIRKFAKDYDAAYARLFEKLDREPTDSEIAEEMGVTSEKLNSYSAKNASAQTLSFEEIIFEGGYDIPDKEKTDSNSWQPEQRLLDGEMKQQLIDAIDKLSERERLVITLYYYEKLRYIDIAEVIGVSESRVCQIHSSAVSKMRKTLKGYIDG